MKKIKELIVKHRELLLYVIFGAATTAVNFVVFYGMEKQTGTGAYLINNVIAWLAAVIFAYVTNKLFVFRVKSWAGKVVVRELVQFFGARVFSLAVEEAGLWLFVQLLQMNTMIAKLVLAVVVVVLNYIFSKLVIFKKA